MTHRGVKLGVGSCNAALLLVLLVCITGKGVDAFVATRSIVATSQSTASTRYPRRAAVSTTSFSASTTRRPRSQRTVPSTRLGAAFIPAPLSCGRRQRKARCSDLHATRCCADDDRPDWVASNENGALNQRRSDNFGSSTPAEIQDDGVTNGRGGFGQGGEAGGFGWLREFGNGNMDITGLVLSTVLLMTAVAPMG